MQLRPYQIQALDDIRSALGRGRRVLYQLPTGGGKTVVFSAICRSARVPVLILVHRQELLLQASASLNRAGVAHQVVAPRHVAEACLTTPGATVTLATVQSAARRRLEHDPGLIVMDEAHHAVCGSWASVAYRWPSARVVGFSATPCRLDGSGLRSAFDVLSTGPTVSQLVDGGHLCPVDAWSLASVDLVGLGETDPEMVRRVAPLVGDAIRHWRGIGGERPAIAFCVSVEAARSLAERFRAEGVPSECIDGKMSHEDRQRAVERLRSGAVRVLTSCEIVSEGFDCPGAEVAILMRPTKSLSLHLQQVGRVMRPAPGKRCGIVLDMVGNVLRHGLPDDPREWSLDGAPARRTGEAGLAIRTCPGCFRAFRPAPCCPRCGTEIPSRPRKVELVDGALRKWSAEELRAEREAVKVRLRDEMRTAARQGIDALHALAIRRGYAPGWARKYYAASRGRR